MFPPEIAGKYEERYLWLNETTLTDACLPSLQSLKKLRFLEIGPNISQSSAAALQAHLPHCDIAGHDPAGKNQFQPKAVQVAP